MDDLDKFLGQHQRLTRRCFLRLGLAGGAGAFASRAGGEIANVIGVRVTDNGSQPLTASTNFTVVGLFTWTPGALAAGSTNPVAVVVTGGIEAAEIENMRQDLFEMGLSSAVFKQSEISATNLGPFQLVIWDDQGGQTLTNNPVDILQGLRQSKTDAHPEGMPLYLIGEHLVGAMSWLGSAEQIEWQALTQL